VVTAGGIPSIGGQAERGGWKVPLIIFAGIVVAVLGIAVPTAIVTASAASAESAQKAPFDSQLTVWTSDNAMIVAMRCEFMNTDFADPPACADYVGGDIACMASTAAARFTTSNSWVSSAASGSSTYGTAYTALACGQTDEDGAHCEMGFAPAMSYCYSDGGHPTTCSELQAVQDMWREYDDNEDKLHDLYPQDWDRRSYCGEALTAAEAAASPAYLQQRYVCRLGVVEH